jgi:elongation factor G
MSSKTNAAATQVNSPDDVRNVVLIGNAGSGKTSLFEQLLKARVSGYRGEKIDAERTAQLYLASLATGDVQVNLLDGPGHPDFLGELRAGIRAADAAIFVVSAADGIDPAAQSLWNECATANLPRIIALTKLDAGHADFDASVASLQGRFGAGVLPTHVPTIAPDGIIGNIGLLSLEEHDYAKGAMVVRSLTADDSHVETHRGPLIEAIIQEAEDDSLMERYLGGETLDTDYLLDDLMKAVATGNLFPVVPVASNTGVGVEELLKLIEHGFPTPSLHPNPPITSLAGEDLPNPPTDPSAPLVAQVIRTTTDPFAGKLSMVRIFSGSLHTDDVVHICGHRPEPDQTHPGHDNDERIGAIQVALGAALTSTAKAIAGEIVMLPKLATAETGDTLSAKTRPALVAPWTLPTPLLPLAIRAATRNDEDKLATALARLAVEDATVGLDRGSGDQLVLWTTGQTHAELLLSRLTGRYGVKVETEDVKIPLRETFIAKASGLGRHVKQSGGHGQYAVCHIEVEPLPRGAGFEFVDKVVGGAVPRQFIPSVEKGVKTQLSKGVFAGYPMTDVRVTLLDGKSHSVDSSDMAFQLAGALAIKEAAHPSSVALLEPLDLVQVTVGEEYLGAVLNDLTGRRGQLLGTDAVGTDAVIKALVPQSELSRYAIDLRGIAHGSGTFTREFHGYQVLPPALTEKYAKTNL